VCETAANSGKQSSGVPSRASRLQKAWALGLLLKSLFANPRQLLPLAKFALKSRITVGRLIYRMRPSSLAHPC
jgi:hypothetical protein